MVGPAKSLVSWWALLGVMVFITSSGCALTQRRSETSAPTTAKVKVVKPPKGDGPATEILANWSKQVQVGMDPVSQSPMPAITGRIYFFDSSGGYPIGVEGDLTVELYEQRIDPTGKPKLLETWKFDPESLKLLGRNDTLGFGYNLALPWSTYRPDIRRVHMVVKFEPKHGMPLTAMSHVISLDHDQPEQVAKTTGKKLGPLVVQTSANE